MNIDPSIRKIFRLSEIVGRLCEAASSARRFIPPSLSFWRTSEKVKLAALILLTSFLASPHLRADWPSWQAEMFTAEEMENPIISGLGADSDLDGWNNLQEYAFNLDPGLREPSPVLTTIEDGYLVLSFTRLKVPQDLLYTVEVSTDLQTWEAGVGFVTELEPVSMDDLYETAFFAANTLVSSAVKQFMRVRVTFVPPPAAPDSVTGTVEADNSVTLHWTDHADNETDFLIERSDDGGLTWTQAASVGANVTTANISEATFTTQFRVSAQNGSGTSGGSTAATPSVPNPDGDDDNDGLSNQEEWEFGTLRKNPDTDGDGTDDGEDGWANETTEPKFAPKRLPITSYALVDLGVYTPLFQNDLGQVVLRSANKSFLWKNGQLSEIGENNLRVTGLNNAGKIVGIKLSSQLSPNLNPEVFVWENGNTSYLQHYQPPPAGDRNYYYGNPGNLGFGDGAAAYEKDALIDGANTLFVYERLTYSDDNGTWQDSASVIQYPNNISPATSKITFSNNELAIYPYLINESGIMLAQKGSWDVGPENSTGVGIWDESGFHEKEDHTALWAISKSGHVIGSNEPSGEHFVLMRNHQGTYSKKNLEHQFLGDVVGRKFNDRMQYVFGPLIWQNYKVFDLSDFVPVLTEDNSPWASNSLEARGINENGMIVGTAVRTKDGNGDPLSEHEQHAVLLLPIELKSKDRILRGSIDIPEGWTDFGLSFRNKTKNQDLGLFEKLEPGAAGSTVKIYDSPDDFFSDEEMEQNQSGSLPDNVKNQKVTFARDPENPRKLQFCAVFDDVGEIEVKIKFGPNGTEGIASHTLTADTAMSGFINQMAERVSSIEVPGSEELPIDLDGDGIPDGSGNSDLIQAHQPGSMAIAGAQLSEELEDDPLNLVLPINDDDDDVASQADNANTSIGADDNDVSRLLLKRPGNLTSNTGTLTLTVSHPSSVRVFKSDGSAPLSTYTVNLASPSGDLAGLANGSVPIYVEGLAVESDVTFTLTYRNASNVVVSSDSVHLAVADVPQFALMQMLGGMQMVAGDSPKVRMRSYAANGAMQMATMKLAPIGENPPLKNRGFLSKILFDHPLQTNEAIDLAFTLGVVDGFWIALKGEKDVVVGAWNFFRNDPMGRSAAICALCLELQIELAQMSESEKADLLENVAKNITDDLYTQAELALPWAPMDPNLSPEVLFYMGGFATGTVTEGLAVSALGAGIATKTATVTKGIITTAKAQRYALSTLSALRKASIKSTHILLRLAKSEEGCIHIGAIAKRLEKIDLPSGKKVPESFEEALHDKPELTDKVVEAYHYHGQAVVDEARAASRYQKCVHSLAELHDLLGSTLTDLGKESFAKLQQRMFVKGVDSADCLPELKEMFDTPSAAGKTKLNQFLEDSKAILDDPASIPGTGPFPGNRGFAGTPANQTLPQGKIISRYGSNNGEFLADDGIPIWARSLPDGTDPNSLRRYEVLQPFQTSAGRTAPWFGKPGGGIQYDLGVGNTVQELLDAGILREIIQ